MDSKTIISITITTTTTTTITIISSINYSIEINFDSIIANHYLDLYLTKY